MRGRINRQTNLFVKINLEELVPPGHPLGAVKRMADEALAVMGRTFAAACAPAERGGRPSIPPERLLKALVLLSLYTVRSERVKSKLEAAAPLMFKEVIFEKLVDFYVGLDDWTFQETWSKTHRFGITSEWFQRLRNVPEFHKYTGRYHQLISALDHQVAAELKCRLYPVRIDLTPDDPREQEDRHVLAHLNHTMFEAYPYIEGPKLVLLCTSPLFTVLEPEIDWTFFARGTIDVP